MFHSLCLMVWKHEQKSAVPQMRRISQSVSLCNMRLVREPLFALGWSTKDRVPYISLFIDPLPSVECTTGSSHKKEGERKRFGL